MTGTLNQPSPAELALALDQAAQRAQALPQFDPDGRLPLTHAYAVQAALIGHRLARGERRAGVKMGFTSRAKMAQMGIADVIWGRLTNAMHLEEGGVACRSRYVHPRIEPELAFVLKRDLAGDVTAAQALAAVEAVAPALELIDSRYQNFKFTLPEVIADNASSSSFVVGSWHSPKQDLADLGMVLTVNGRVVQVGSTAAILGHPIRSLVAAARLSAAAGEPLQAGWVVMAGGATPAEWIHAEQTVSLALQGMGQVALHVQA